MDFKNLIKFKKENLFFSTLFFFISLGATFVLFRVWVGMGGYELTAGAIVAVIWGIIPLIPALIIIIPISSLVDYLFYCPGWLVTSGFIVAAILGLISVIFCTHLLARFISKWWRRSKIGKIVISCFIIFSIIAMGFFSLRPVHHPDRYVPRDMLKVLDIECIAETPTLSISLINSGTQSINMIPFDVIVYDSGGKVTSITKTNINESSLSDSTKWKSAQKPGGYTGSVNITLSDNFIGGEYYSSILLGFHNSNYELETSCQAN